MSRRLQKSIAAMRSRMVLAGHVPISIRETADGRDVSAQCANCKQWHVSNAAIRVCDRMSIQEARG